MNQHIIKYIFLIIACLYISESFGQACVGTAGEVTWSYWRELPDDEFGEMYAHQYYPSRPDGSRIISSVQSPENFDNNFGSVIKGFISVPSTQNVLFNITGDDDVRFYLSTDELPANVQMEASITGWTGRDEHDKYPEQSSRSINLVGGAYYYFELHHIEGGGGDHCGLYWKNNLTGQTVWNYVSSQYIASVGCLPDICPERGEACDDGDASTVDDQQDGYCNCVGGKTNQNNCIGERSTIEAYYYDGTPGGDLSDLYMDPNFPAMPQRYEKLDMFGVSNRMVADSFGTLIQAYLTVPVSGNYEFNVTANVEAIFFISSGEDPTLKQTHQILTSNSTGTTEHDKYIYQSTAPLYLEKGKYYYIEMNHKESSYTEHFSIFWKTPFRVDDHWKRLPAFYIYDYDCEISCMPQGVLCDDGDPFTNNDAFDANCNCVGIPCSGPDCLDRQASYVPYPECGLTDQLDNIADASWLSCATSPSPKASYGNKHWLQYDLGKEHRIWNSQVWNYNVSGDTQEGFQEVMIDYSLDGVSWTNLGNYNWSQATGDSEYSGFSGPDFGGAQLRYILVTAMDGENGCRGISKMTFASRACGVAGETCDDGNVNTNNDVFDNNCNCIGDALSFNNCGRDTLMLGDSSLSLMSYSAIKFINSNSDLSNGSDVTFMANESIELGQGFESATGAILTIKIDDCTQTQSLVSPKGIRNLKDQMQEQPIIIMRSDETDQQVIGFHVSEPGQVVLEVLDNDGLVISQLVNNQIANAGYYTKRIRTAKFDRLTYVVRLKSKSGVYKEVLVVDQK